MIGLSCAPCVERLCLCKQTDGRQDTGETLDVKSELDGKTNLEMESPSDARDSVSPV